MFGVLTGALDARKVAYDAATLRGEVTALMTGTDYFARIKSIVIMYELTVPSAQLAATERALRVHPRGCAAHEKLAAHIPITWRARVRSGDQMVTLEEVVAGVSLAPEK